MRNQPTVGYMHFERGDHTAAVLINGNVLVTGGLHAGDPFVLAQTELYYSSTQTWIPTDK
jgi:hypothetical protein